MQCTIRGIPPAADSALRDLSDFIDSWETDRECLDAIGDADSYRQPRPQGTPLPTNDRSIPALVVPHEIALHPRDRHFDRLPRIVRA